MPHLLSALCVVLISSQYAEAYLVTACEVACRKTDIGDNDAICKECAIKPKLDYNLCVFACGTKHLNDSVHTICKKCFENWPFMMKYVCSYACRNTKDYMNKQVCDTCPPHVI